MKRTVLLLSLASAGCAGFGQDRAPVTPQRPTLSNNTATTAEGTVEVEAGVAIDPGDSFDSPVVGKWGMSERSELFVAWSPWVVVDVPGNDLDGASDLAVGMRHRFADETAEMPSAAFQLTTKLPTANDEIGTGEHDFFAAVMLDKRVAEVDFTAFYQLGLLGDPAGRGAETGHDVALAAALALDDRWGVFGELAGRFVSEYDYDSVFLTGGVTFAQDPSLVFDAGLVAGLSDDAPDAVFQVGMTHNLGRLFSGRQ